MRVAERPGPTSIKVFMPIGSRSTSHFLRFYSNNKEIIKLNHEAFDRALYSEGALSAARWIMKKKPGLYSMRDLMNFK